VRRHAARAALPYAAFDAELEWLEGEPPAAHGRPPRPARPATLRGRAFDNQSAGFGWIDSTSLEIRAAITAATVDCSA
jgi:hypothetical protein